MFSNGIHTPLSKRYCLGLKRSSCPKNLSLTIVSAFFFPKLLDFSLKAIRSNKNLPNAHFFVKADRWHWESFYEQGSRACIQVKINKKHIKLRKWDVLRSYNVYYVKFSGRSSTCLTSWKKEKTTQPL